MKRDILAVICILTLFVPFIVAFIKMYQNRFRERGIKELYDIIKEGRR